MIYVDETLSIYSPFLEKFQELVAQAVTLESSGLMRPRNVCGLDISYHEERAAASAVVLTISGGELVEAASSVGRPAFPYIPGFLFMREAPLMLSATTKLVAKPDLLLVDGHGLAHPRNAGLASVIGVMTDLPTIGVAKSLLAGEVGSFRKGFAKITLKRREVGFAVRPSKTRAFYVSPGNHVTIDDLAALINLLGQEYPKALRMAHQVSKEVVRESE